MTKQTRSVIVLTGSSAAVARDKRLAPGVLPLTVDVGRIGSRVLHLTIGPYSSHPRDDEHQHSDNHSPENEIGRN